MIDPAMAQPTPTQPFPLEDFSGGMTDFYLNGPLNRYQTADNLLIAKYGQVGKLFTRPGSEIYDDDYYQIPVGAQRIGTLKYFTSTLFYQSARKIYYVNSGWTTLQGPSSNDLFPSGIDTTTVVSMSTWNGIMLVTSSALVGKVSKIYKDSGGTWRLRTAGLPDLATSPTATPTSTDVISLSYLYRFIHKYTYTVGSVTFIDRGPATEVAAVDASGSEIAGGAACSIASIPVLANGSTDNYDTASSNLKIEIYRTTNFGSNFFYVGEVSNGTTTYSDTTTDAALVDAEPLYTEAGIPDNDPPPLCKVLHIVDDRALFGHCKVGSEVFKTRVYQSVPGDIDSVPLENFATLPDDVVTLSSHKSVPVALCAGSNYRLEGGYDELGGGFISPVVISDTHGCVSQQSAVQTPYGVFWAGHDGFYWTDGYQSLRVSGDLRESYQLIVASDTRKSRVQGKYDSKENRVYWTAQYGSSATECDACFVLDLNWGISDSMPFTTLGGTSFAPTALEFIGANLIRGHKSGYTFIHRSTLYVDPVVDTSALPSTWASETLIYNLVTIATNFGTSKQRKWVPSCSVICENETNVSLQIVSINDDGRRSGNLKPIRFVDNVTWGDPDVYWGDPAITWNNQGIIDEFRRMPAGGLRCQFKQAQLTNAHVAIINSETLGTATVDPGALTVTLDNTAAYDWPSASVGYYIAFDHDDYETEFLVLARTNDALTIQTAGGGAPSGSRSWVIRGKPKGEVLFLNIFTFNFAVFGETMGKFRQAATGEVAASDA